MSFVHAADPRPVRAAARRLPASRLLVFTSVCSVDGTMVMLAATGVLSTWTGVLVTGLTVVAGAGAWLAARSEFAGRRLDREDVALLALLAATSALAAAAAGYVGARLASGPFDLVVLPRASGVVLLLLALEVGGARVPREGRVPLAPHVLGSALELERGGAVDSLTGALLAVGIGFASILAAIALPLDRWVPPKRVRLVGAWTLSAVAVSVLGVPVPPELPLAVLVVGLGLAAVLPRDAREPA